MSGLGTVRRVDGQWLRRWATADAGQTAAEGAYLIAYRWGPAATWCLRPELLSKAAEAARDRDQQRYAEALRTRPVLPVRGGTAWVLFAAADPNAYPALRRCFLLPLCWSQVPPLRPELPRNLLDVARRALELAGRAARRADAESRWFLRLNADAGFAGYDFSRLDDDQFSCESGAVPLAASALLTMEGGLPSGDVWASGGVDEDGRVRRVDMLEPKVRLAVECGARHLFVPGSQVVEARREAAVAGGSSLLIGALDESASDMPRALGDYLAQLDLPPRNGHFEQQRDWYLRQSGFRRGGVRNEQLERYYRDELLEPIIERARRCLLADLGGELPELGYLVTIASEAGRDLVALSAGVLRCGRVLILFTPQSRPAAEAARDDILRRCRRWDLACDVLLAECRDELLQGGSRSARLAWGGQFRAWIERCWPQADPSRIVLDVTPGSKEMSLAMVLDAAREGNQLLYIRQYWRGTERLPGEELPVLLPAPKR